MIIKLINELRSSNIFLYYTVLNTQLYELRCTTFSYKTLSCLGKYRTAALDSTRFRNFILNKLKGNLAAFVLHDFVILCRLVTNSLLFQAVEAELGHFRWQEHESHYTDILQLKLKR